VSRLATASVEIEGFDQSHSGCLVLFSDLRRHGTLTPTDADKPSNFPGYARDAANQATQRRAIRSGSGCPSRLTSALDDLEDVAAGDIGDVKLAVGIFP